jgi:hypothetical protein
MIAAAAHGTSIEALFVVLIIVWVAAVLLFCTRSIDWLSRIADRRSIRRCQRDSVRAVRGLGAQLLADEAKLRGQS